MSNISTYLNNLIEEKDGISMGSEIIVEGPSGTNFMTLETVVEHILIAPKHEQDQIRKTLVMIDFKNGDVMHFFKYLAQAIAR
jgi:hypothetical protein